MSGMLAAEHATSLPAPIQSVFRYFRLDASDEPAPGPSRIQILLWVALMLGVLAVALMNYDAFQLGTWDDDSSYAVLAESLVFSDSYGLSNVPGTPLPTRYPLGYPLVLSLVVRLYPHQPLMLRSVALIATLFNTALLFWGWPLLSQRRSHWWGLGVGALSSLSPMMIFNAQMVMSEPVFLSFVLLTLILAEYYLRVPRRKWLWGLLLGLAMTMAVLTRTIGIVVVIAVFLRLILAGPLRRFLPTAASVVLGIGLCLASIVLLTPARPADFLPSEYLNQATNPTGWNAGLTEGTLIERVSQSLVMHLRSVFRETVLPVGGGIREQEFGQRFGISDLSTLVGLGVSALIGLGLISVLVGKGLQPTALLFTMGFVSAMFAWPWYGARFLYAVQPLLIFLMIAGIALLASLADRPRFRWKASNIVAAIAVLALLAVTLSRSVNTNTEPTVSPVRDFSVGTGWLAENTPADAVVMAEQSRAIYLYSQRRTVDYDYNISDAAALQAYWDETGADYVMVAPFLTWRPEGDLIYDDYTRDVFIPLIDDLRAADTLQLVYESPADMVTIYQILH